MRRFFRSITQFSLIQQLVLIIFAVVFGIYFFFTVYLRGNIDDFVESQVISMLQTSQERVIEELGDKTPGESNFSYDREIMHFIFHKGKFQTYIGIMIYDDNFLSVVTEKAVSQEDKLAQGTIKTDTVYYYRCVKIDKNRTIISLMSENYAKEIEASLLRNIANTSAIAVSVMFLVVMLWATSIITPLQQIRNYIDKVRKGDDKAVLKMERNDEIGELARELVSLKEDLKHEEKAKEEMIHNISHDLKTPIATIKSYAESIKDGIYPYDTLEKSVDVIIDNADRLEQKVHSLLFLNRLDYMLDQELAQGKVCDMKDTVETVLLSLKMIRPEVSIDCHLEEATFVGDDESWRVVVENLLDNALRYAKSKIVITLKNDELTISNDGPSLSEERRQKLFKPFEKGTKGKFGLGLSICYRVCVAYGYNIDAENLEEGVIFKISLKEPDKKDKKKQIKN